MRKNEQSRLLGAHGQGIPQGRGDIAEGSLALLLWFTVPGSRNIKQWLCSLIGDHSDFTALENWMHALTTASCQWEDNLSISIFFSRSFSLSALIPLPILLQYAPCCGLPKKAATVQPVGKNTIQNYLQRSGNPYSAPGWAQQAAWCRVSGEESQEPTPVKQPCCGTLHSKGHPA